MTPASPAQTADVRVPVTWPTRWLQLALAVPPCVVTVLGLTSCCPACGDGGDHGRSGRASEWKCACVRTGSGATRTGTSHAPSRHGGRLSVHLLEINKANRRTSGLNQFSSKYSTSPSQCKTVPLRYCRRSIHDVATTDLCAYDATVPCAGKSDHKN